MPPAAATSGCAGQISADRLWARARTYAWTSATRHPPGRRQMSQSRGAVEANAVAGALDPQHRSVSS